MEIPSDLPPQLVPLAWLLGRWEGAGVVGYPTMPEDRHFGQELEVLHEGGAFLTWRSRTWLLDEEGRPEAPLSAESGYWRAGDDGAVELLLAHPSGHVEIWLGEARGPRIELRTDLVARTSTASDYTAGHRLYGLVQGSLAWVFEKAADGHPLQSHMSAQLKRA